MCTLLDIFSHKCCLQAESNTRPPKKSSRKRERFFFQHANAREAGLEKLDLSKGVRDVNGRAQSLSGEYQVNLRRRKKGEEKRKEKGSSLCGVWLEMDCCFFFLLLQRWISWKRRRLSCDVQASGFPYLGCYKGTNTAQY